MATNLYAKGTELVGKSAKWVKTRWGVQTADTDPTLDQIGTNLVYPLQRSGQTGFNEPSDKSDENTKVALSFVAPVGKPTVLVLFRRFGCPLCRMSAANLQALQPIFARKGIRLVGLGLETEGFHEFISSTGWQETLAIDSDRGVYKQLGTVGHNWTTLPGVFASIPMMANAARKAAQLGYREGNIRGDKTQLGGTFAFDESGRCVYAHRQDAWSFEPDLLGMLRALKASDDDINEAKSVIYQKKAAKGDKAGKQAAGSAASAGAQAESAAAG